MAETFKYVGTILHLPEDQELYTEVACACNSHNQADGHSYSIREVEGQAQTYECYQLPDPTAEEIAQQELAQAKAERANAVENITVEVDGMIFQGDETSQTRMSRSIVAMNDEDRITWVLADDTIAQVSKAQLQEALRKAGEKQTELWTKPYEEDTPQNEEETTLTESDEASVVA